MRDVQGRELLGLRLRAAVHASCRADRTTPIVVQRRLRQPPRTAPASCTSRRPSARTTWRSAADNDLPVLHDASTPDGRFIAEVTPVGAACSSRTPTRRSSTRPGRRAACCSRAERYVHNYPFCWRCDTPLIYYAQDAWYIRTTAVKDQLVELNETINWVPGAHQATAASATGSRTTSTGRCRASATGARRCRSGDATDGAHALHRLGRRSSSEAARAAT